MRIQEPYDRYAVLVRSALKGRGLGYLLMQLMIESAAPKAPRLV